MSEELYFALLLRGNIKDLSKVFVCVYRVYTISHFQFLSFELTWINVLVTLDAITQRKKCELNLRVKEQHVKVAVDILILTLLCFV